METKTNIKSNMATYRPTRRDLIFAPPAFFCFSANPHLAHLPLPTYTQAARRAKAKELNFPIPLTIKKLYK